MKIVIVGGGTAGWLSALFLSKIKKDHEIVVIESSKTGIIGVGESSTGALTDVINNVIWNFNCDPIDFFQETGATLKYGIKHINWTDDNSFYFGPIDGTPTNTALPDGMFALGIKENLKNLHNNSFYGQLMDQNIGIIDKDTKKFIVDTHALHFDTNRVGKYFSKICLKENHVKHIDAEVVDIILNSLGEIDSVILNNKQKITGDFFVDASGFHRLLISKLENTWISYKEHLPVNRALPFVLEYTDDEHPWPWTTAWAQDAGWMWQIPLQDRVGCGYVYCDDFISPDQAHQELEKKLGKRIEPLKDIKFESGRQKDFWIKNCLAVGLAGAFAEPLESTSVHGTIIQLLNFTFEYLCSTKEDTCNSGSIARYNKRTAQMYDDFKDFINCHYQGKKISSEFWKHITYNKISTDFVNEILEMSKSKMPTHNDFNFYPGAAGWSLWSYILAGTNNIDVRSAYSQMYNAVDLNVRQQKNNLDDHIKYLKSTCIDYKQFNRYIRDNNIRYL